MSTLLHWADKVCVELLILTPESGRAGRVDQLTLLGVATRRRCVVSLTCGRWKGDLPWNAGICTSSALTFTYITERNSWTSWIISSQNGANWQQKSMELPSGYRLYVSLQQKGWYCYKSINCKTSRERKKTIFTQDETISIHHFLMKFWCSGGIRSQIGNHAKQRWYSKLAWTDSLEPTARLHFDVATRRGMESGKSDRLCTWTTQERKGGREGNEV